MIITVADLKNRINCGTATDDVIKARLEAIESVIRAYTNNNFQNRGVRFTGRSEDTYVYGVPQFFAVGDTIQISGSVANDGLYIVEDVQTDCIQLNKNLVTAEYNLVTKIQYPADVIQCAVDMFQWKQSMGGKIGVKSETISRHSVTYEDSGSLFMGYPVGILNGLTLHKKARC